MKRVTMPVTLVFDVDDDDADAIKLSEDVYGATRSLTELGLISTGFARSTVTPLREAVCRIDGARFVEPLHFPEGKPLPDICPMHAQAEEDDDVAAEHAPMFDEVRRLSDGKLEPRIWHSGGGTMTIVIPVSGTDEYPRYLGLKEGEEDSGEWLGSLGFYRSEEEDEDGAGEEIVTPDETPQGWARGVVDHWRSLTA